MQPAVTKTIKTLVNPLTHLVFSVIMLSTITVVRAYKYSYRFDFLTITEKEMGKRNIPFVTVAKGKKQLRKNMSHSSFTKTRHPNSKRVRNGSIS